MASAYEPGEVTWVEVPGGRLAVEVNRQDSEPVLAIHGISSQDPDDPLLLDYLAHDLYGPLVRLDADALAAEMLA